MFTLIQLKMLLSFSKQHRLLINKAIFLIVLFVYDLEKLVIMRLFFMRESAKIAEIFRNKENIQNHIFGKLW